MEKEKALALSKKIIADILEANVVSGNAFVAIALASSDLVDAIVGTTEAKHEEVVATLVECIVAACKPGEEDNTPQD